MLRKFYIISFFHLMGGIVLSQAIDSPFIIVTIGDTIISGERYSNTHFGYYKLDIDKANKEYFQYNVQDSTVYCYDKKTNTKKVFLSLKDDFERGEELKLDSFVRSYMTKVDKYKFKAKSSLVYYPNIPGYSMIDSIEIIGMSKEAIFLEIIYFVKGREKHTILKVFCNGGHISDVWAKYQI